jgi:uncharacterized membrane protein
MSKKEDASRTTIRKSVTIARPLDEVFHAFEDVSFLPRFMEHLASVSHQSGARWRWLPRPFEGTADVGEVEVVDRQEGRLVRWRWLEDEAVRGDGTVSFREAPAGRGTEVTIELAYDARGGKPGRWIQKLMGTEPRQQLSRDLFRLRQLLETGEIASTVGQPAARENAGGEMLTLVGQPTGRSTP